MSWVVPISVYAFIVLTALVIAAGCLGLLAVCRWAWGWLKFCWAEREVFLYYWRLQFKRSKGKR